MRMADLTEGIPNAPVSRETPCWQTSKILVKGEAPLPVLGQDG
jgi:hypothetical protein